MKQRISRFLKHALLTILILATVIIGIGYFMGASAHFGDNPLAMTLNNEGPYIFFENDSVLNVNYIKGNTDNGFTLTKEFIRLIH
ncbi:MAG: hypothetical protein GY861_22775 [bacterium]|nr:hypothetical protein [bacterium]